MLYAFLVIQRQEKLSEEEQDRERSYIRLCINDNEKYTGKENVLMVETDLLKAQKTASPNNNRNS